MYRIVTHKYDFVLAIACNMHIDMIVKIYIYVRKKLGKRTRRRLVVVLLLILLLSTTKLLPLLLLHTVCATANTTITISTITMTCNNKSYDIEKICQLHIASYGDVFCLKACQCTMKHNWKRVTEKDEEPYKPSK